MPAPTTTPSFAALAAMAHAAQSSFGGPPRPPRRRKKTPPRAPTSIVPLPNADKLNHDPGYAHYPPTANLARYPGPFRCCIIGRVNSGKSLLVKHILLAHQEAVPWAPPFEEVYIVHGMGSTREYADLEPTEMMTQIPAWDDFDPDTKKLLIIDDYDFTAMKPEVKQRVSELFRFGSTHQNMSIILAHQSWFRVPKVAKDCSNVFIIYRPVDMDELATIGRRVGLRKADVYDIFDRYMPTFRDSLCINLIPGAPHKLTKNLFEPLETPATSV